MGHAAVFNPYYGGNVIYPMYPSYGMPGFSAHSVSICTCRERGRGGVEGVGEGRLLFCSLLQLPKPSAGSSYPGGGVNSYQAPSGAGFGYEEVAGVSQDYKMYGGMAGSLGKPHPMTSSAADMPSGGGSYKQLQGFDSSKSGGNYSSYSVPQGGMGGYGFIPTGVSHGRDGRCGGRDGRCGGRDLVWVSGSLVYKGHPKQGAPSVYTSHLSMHDV